MSKPRSLITSTALAISTPTPARTRNARRPLLVVVLTIVVLAAASPSPRRGRVGALLLRRGWSAQAATDVDAAVTRDREEDAQRQQAGKHPATAAAPTTTDGNRGTARPFTPAAQRTPSLVHEMKLKTVATR